jgi:hypothetical protein
MWWSGIADCCPVADKHMLRKGGTVKPVLVLNSALSLLVNVLVGWLTNQP